MTINRLLPIDKSLTVKSRIKYCPGVNKYLIVKHNESYCYDKNTLGGNTLMQETVILILIALYILKAKKFIYFCIS